MTAGLPPGVSARQRRDAPAPATIAGLPAGTQQRQRRAAPFERATLDAEKRTIELAFSSEEPVERWWGMEILGHSAGEIDDDFIGSGTAPLLMDHNTRDVVGVVESVTRGADRKMRATVRFSRSARAEEVMQDVADGIRANVSVGYELLEVRLEKEEKGKPPVYRATRWRPLEVSLVAVPADPTVGVGREMDAPPTPSLPAEPKKEVRMSETIEKPPVREPTADEISAASARRVSEIMELARIANRADLGVQAIQDGLPIEQFRGKLLALRSDEKRPLGALPTDVGLSEKETKRFSLSRYLLATADKNPALAPFEVEVARTAGQAMEKAGHQTRGGEALPGELLDAPIPGARLDNGRMVVGSGRMQRDLSVGTTAAGGAIVETAVLAPSFIELLRNAMMVRTMGATVLGGLQGNVAIPRQTGALTAGWVSETGAATESDMTFAQVSLTPKTVHAIQDYPRMLLLQGSPDIEGLVRTDLAMVLAIEIDRVALHGTGASNQPTGLAATAGIGSVAGGTNGAVPTWDNIVDLESAVANNNAAVARLGYLTNTRVRGRLKRAPIIAGQAVFIWGGMPGTGTSYFAGPGTINLGEMSVMNEYPAGVSNNVSNTLTKGTSTGVCSAIFFGNWVDLLIGEWGGIETLADNLTQAPNRVIRLHAYQTVDVAVRRAQSFSAMLDALTT